MSGGRITLKCDSPKHLKGPATIAIAWKCESSERRRNWHIAGREGAKLVRTIWRADPGAYQYRFTCPFCTANAKRSVDDLEQILDKEQERGNDTLFLRQLT